MPRSDAHALVGPERRRLADELAQLDADQWSRRSLCGEWTNHEVAAHLVVPFHMGPPAFLWGIVRAGGNFDRANTGFARDLAIRMDPKACVDSLRAHADHRFKPPGFGFEAPITDLITHGVDILHALGRSVTPDPAAARVSLAFLGSGKARKFGAVDVAPLTLAPTDLDGETFGSGPQRVCGPSVALIAAVLGRPAVLDQLSGPGVDNLRASR